MRSQTPKALHDLCGLPMIAWPVRAAREAGAARGGTAAGRGGGDGGDDDAGGPDRVRARRAGLQRFVRARGRDEGRGRRHAAGARDPRGKHRRLCVRRRCAGGVPAAPDGRQRAGRAVPAPDPGPDAVRRAQGGGGGGVRPEHRAGRQRSRRAGARAQARPGCDPRAPHDRRRDDRRSRQHRHRRRRPGRAGHLDRALYDHPRMHPHRRRLRGPALLSGRLHARGRGQRGAVRLPAPWHGAAGCRQGRHLRGGQELRYRSAGESAAPLLHRGRQRRRAVQSGRGLDHRQLRRPLQAPHHDRQPRARRRGHLLRGSRGGGRRFLHGRRLGDHRGRAAGLAGDRTSPPAERRRLRGSLAEGSWGWRFTLRGAMSSIMDTRAEPSRAALPIDYNKRLMLFSGRANPQLAVDIADKLGVELGPVTLKTFSNGEVYCRYKESIRGADVFIVQSTCGNAETGVTANDSLMELLFMIDAAVGASAHRVIAVTPWFGYSRQDKKSAPREPISARLVARMLEAAGADRVLTMDLHAGQIQGFFRNPADHMTALFMLTQHFRDLNLEDLVVVSPDAGRVKLAKKFASKVGAELAILDKERPAQQVAEIDYVIGDVKDRTAVIVDDMIDTAGTLKAAAKTVAEEGAERVYAAATHALFSGNAFENLKTSGLQEIVVTDTIPIASGAGRPDNIRVLPCAELLTDSIRRIFVDDSVSEVFGGENQLF